MFYIEQICGLDQSVRITIHGEGITNALMYRKYKEATPSQPLMIERPGGYVVYVDARESWEEANARAGELAQANGTCYALSGELIRQRRCPGRLAKRWD